MRRPKTPMPEPEWDPQDVNHAITKRLTELNTDAESAPSYIDVKLFIEAQQRQLEEQQQHLEITHQYIQKRLEYDPQGHASKQLELDARQLQLDEQQSLLDTWQPNMNGIPEQAVSIMNTHKRLVAVQQQLVESLRKLMKHEHPY